MGSTEDWLQHIVEQALSSQPLPFDSTTITYVSNTQKVSTVVYKMGVTVVKTATMAYDGSDRLTGIVWS